MVFLVGCSGTLGGNPGLVTRAVTFTVTWGSLSGRGVHRDNQSTGIQALAQSQSIEIRMLGANVDGTDMVLKRNRDLTKPDEYAITYDAPNPVKTGAAILVVICYLKPDQAGSTVGSLKSSVSVSTAPTTNIPISTVVHPKQIVIAPGQTVVVGNTIQLAFNAYDANNTNLVLPNGTFTIKPYPGPTSDYINLNTDQSIKATKSGATALTVTYNDPDNGPLTSSPQLLTIISNIVVNVQPADTYLIVKLVNGYKTFYKNDQTIFENPLKLTATVTTLDGKPANQPGVTWSVIEDPTGKTILQDGTYTVSADPGTYHIVATSLADPGQSAQAIVDVAAANVINISPTDVLTEVGKKIQFQARIAGLVDTNVTWSVVESDGGTIDASGTYTAPPKVGLFHIVCTKPNTSLQSTTTVNVSDHAGTIIIR